MEKNKFYKHNIVGRGGPFVTEVQFTIPLGEFVIWRWSGTKEAAVPRDFGFPRRRAEKQPPPPPEGCWERRVP